MVAQTNEVVPTIQSDLIDLVTFTADRPFSDVVASFETQLGVLDQQKALADPSTIANSVKSMEGTSGLMIIAVLDMHKLLPDLSCSKIQSRQYLVGNPLIADRMAKFNTLATLFAPPRVLIYTHGEKTCITYERPSTTFGRLGSKEILEVARDLDEKFERLVRQSLFENAVYIRQDSIACRLNPTLVGFQARSRNQKE